MTSNDFRASADVSCPRCGAGWWVTNPDRFAWDGCEDCRDDEAESDVAMRALIEADGQRGTAVVLLGGTVICLAWLFYIVWLISRAT